MKAPWNTIKKRGAKNVSKRKEVRDKMRISRKALFDNGYKVYNWMGEKGSYVAKHVWVKNHYGKPYRCENTGCTFKNPKRYEWANISGKYKRLNRNDWIMLCPSCHRRYDNGSLIL
jgi:glutamine amidotransferase-like uncharacterized protein